MSLYIVERHGCTTINYDGSVAAFYAFCDRGWCSPCGYATGAEARRVVMEHVKVCEKE